MLFLGRDMPQPVTEETHEEHDEFADERRAAVEITEGIRHEPRPTKNDGRSDDELYLLCNSSQPRSCGHVSSPSLLPKHRRVVVRPAIEPRP